jgi:acetylglutamate kinase
LLALRAPVALSTDHSILALLADSSSSHIAAQIGATDIVTATTVW